MREFSVYHAVFDVAQKVTKVDVEEIARRGDHDVVVVAISNALWWRGGVVEGRGEHANLVTS